MGAWSASIIGNDTANDLRSEYTVAFSCFDVPNALQEIDKYVRREMFDESDEEGWCDYNYSLADFMWKKGILTDAVRDTAVNMIDSEFGLTVWAESGNKILAQRKKNLESFKKQILSPMPSKKKIKPDIHTNTIFETGEIIAIQLQTAGKPYTENTVKAMSEDEFHNLDGKYILIQKIKDHSSWQSSIVPEIHDYWAVFRLFDGVYDAIPENVDINTLKDAKIDKTNGFTPLFLCESSMSYFKKRKYQVICCDHSSTYKYSDMNSESIFLSINKPWRNPDSSFMAAMGKEIAFYQSWELTDELKKVIQNANRWKRFNYNLSQEENNHIYESEECGFIRNTEKVLSSGGTIYVITYGIVVGFCTILHNEIKNVYVRGKNQNRGFASELIHYVVGQQNGTCFMKLKSDQRTLLHICEKAGVSVKETD